MKRWWILIFLIGFAVGFSACGGNGSSGDDDHGDDDSSVSPVDDDTAGDVDDDDDNDDSSPPPWNEPALPLRQTTSLDGTWSFTPEGYPARDVTVPCFWEALPSWPDWEQYACPEYLAGTPDEFLQITEGEGWETRTIHRGTYELSIDLPAPPPVTRLRFEAIHHQATVFLNDTEIGTHTGPYWPVTFDASTAVRTGENALRVELNDGQALLGDDGITRYPVGYYSLTDITGLYRSVTLEQLPAIYLDDVFIIPSTRRDDLTIQYTLVNSTDHDTAVWVMSRAVSNSAAVELETTARRLEIAAGQKAKVVVVADWDGAERWTPVNPALYTLRSLVMDATGAPLDLREDRFGFREVWIEDGHFMLNGERLNLFGDNLDDQASRPRYWGPRYLSCETAPETFRRLKEDLNINLVRFHQAPPAECLFALADEMGLMVISESPIYARVDILPPFNRGEEYVENGRRWLADWVVSQRNHPAIVMWSLENEMFMYGFGLRMEQVFSLRIPAQEADAVRRSDGVVTTPRPVSWDGDGSFLWWFYPAKPETVNWHYPFLNYFTIYPGNEWFTDAIAHYEPFLIDGVPTGVGETMVDRRTPEEGQTLDMAKALQGSAVRAMRILGFSDIRPYKLNWAWHDFDPEGNEHPWAPYYHGLYTIEEKERLVKHLRESYHPIAVFDFEYTRVGPNEDGSFGPVALPAATAVERTLVALNDSFLPGASETVAWTVVDETTQTEIAGDEFTLVVPQGGSRVRPISFETPAVDEEHELVLSVTATMEDLPNGPFNTGYRFVVGP
ncbi:MAG: hypothetical protein GX444_08925 [Myxococcales bacterium]|nr:hypothetical protein [Myxococcales bacterium]